MYDLINKNFIDEMDYYFNNLYNDYRKLSDKWYVIDDDIYVNVIEMPGFNKDNINVELKNGIIKINGERDLLNKKIKIKRKINIGKYNIEKVELKDGIMLIYVKNPVKIKSESEKIEIE